MADLIYLLFARLLFAASWGPIPAPDRLMEETP